MSRVEADVLVVGAGLAGSLAAGLLVMAGLRVAVVERGDVPGGRLATSRIRGGLADTGAQFFTVRSAEFQRIVDRWLRQDMVFEWSRGWSDGSLVRAASDGYPRYAARGGFGSLARRLADGLPLYTGISITSLSPAPHGWLATGSDGFAASAAALILTPPVPQSLALLGGAWLPSPARESLEVIRYGSCLCGLFAVEGAVQLPPPGALQRPDAPISWISDNRRKGISPGVSVLTVHAGPEASAARWRQDEETILSWMWEEVRPWVMPSAGPRAARLIRWREAIPLQVHPSPYLAIETLAAPVLFAGDAFAGPRVEGAALSGLAAARALLAAM